MQIFVIELNIGQESAPKSGETRQIFSKAVSVEIGPKGTSSRAIRDFLIAEAKGY